MASFCFTYMYFEIKNHYTYSLLFNEYIIKHLFFLYSLLVYAKYIGLTNVQQYQWNYTAHISLLAPMIWPQEATNSFNTIIG